MAYSEIDPELKDTIEVKLGNIDANEKIIIRLKYLESLKIVN